MISSALGNSRLHRGKSAEVLDKISQVDGGASGALSASADRSSTLDVSIMKVFAELHPSRHPGSDLRLVAMGSANTSSWRLLPAPRKIGVCLSDLAKIVGGLPASCRASHERPARLDGISDNAPGRHSRFLGGKGGKLGQSEIADRIPGVLRIMCAVRSVLCLCIHHDLLG